MLRHKNALHLFSSTDYKTFKFRGCEGHMYFNENVCSTVIFIFHELCTLNCTYTLLEGLTKPC